MNKNTKRVLSAITIASLAVVPDGVAPTVAPSVFNLNGGVVHAAEENIVSVAYHFEGDDNTTVTRVKVNIAENPNATVGDYYPLSKDGADLEYITDGKTRGWVYKKSVGADYRGDLLSKHVNLLGVYTQPKPNNAGTEVKPNNDGNANAGANNDTSEAQASNQQAKKGSSTVASASGKVEAKKASNTAAGSDLPMLLAMVGSALALFSQLFKKSTKEE